MMGWRRLLQLLPNLHINETFEMAEVIRKKWTVSLITPATEASVWTLELCWIMRGCDIPGLLSQEAATDFALNLGETLHCWTYCISISEVIHAGVESVRFPLELFFPRNAIELQLKTSVMDSWSELNFNMRKVLQNSKYVRWLVSQCVRLTAQF